MHCSKPRIGSLPEKAAQQLKAKGKAFRVDISMASYRQMSSTPCATWAHLSISIWNSKGPEPPLGVAEDVVPMVVFLASDETRTASGAPTRSPPVTAPTAELTPPCQSCFAQREHYFFKQ